MRSIWYGLLGLVGLALPVHAQVTQYQTVRVRLLENEAPAEVRVEAVDGYLTLSVDGVESGGVAPGETVTLSRQGTGIHARFAGADLSGREIRLDAERLRLRAGRVDRQYVGGLVGVLLDGRLGVVNHTPIEPYVASVVQSEFGFPVLEGAKAQAVLARTYAVRRAGQFPHYDLDDHQGSQVYRGVDAATDVSRRAAHETAGQVLTYAGEVADAYYSSSSGGHTADNEAVWEGTPVPYLRGVEDPYDTASPDHTWRTTARRDAVLRGLSSRYGGRVEGVEVVRRSRSGHVLEVRLLGGRREMISGAAFRLAVNAVAGARTVRSTKVEVSVEGDQYVFRGGGYGHGVGMSQYGALGQARAGRSYREILAHYFVGTEVRGGITATPVLGPVAVGTTPQAVPREPASALRTRYRPATARTWPTPRRLAREGIVTARRPDIAAEAPPPAPATPQPDPTARRTAW